MSAGGSGGRARDDEYEDIPAGSSRGRAHDDDDENMEDAEPSSKKSKFEKRKRERQQMATLNRMEEEIRATEKKEKLDVMDVLDMADKLRSADTSDSKKASNKVAVKDAMVTSRLMKAGQRVMKESSMGTQQFTVKELVQKILHKFSENMIADDNGEDGEQHMKWEKMRIEVAGYFTATPSCPFLATELCKNVKPKEKKARAALSQRKEVVESRPIYGTSESTDSKNNSEKRKRQMIQQLEKQKDQSVSLADFVVNPDSFGETVENLFACGMMISEHLGGIRNDGSGNLELYKTEPPEEHENANLKRAIVKFDYTMFKDLVRQREAAKAPFKFNPSEAEIQIARWEETAMSGAETAMQRASTGGRGSTGAFSSKGRK